MQYLLDTHISPSGQVPFSQEEGSVPEQVYLAGATGRVREKIIMQTHASFFIMVNYGLDIKIYAYSGGMDGILLKMGK